MDINAQDRLALKERNCPDCGRRVSLEEATPWCSGCDVWFQLTHYGWVIRNKNAARYFTLQRAARSAQRPRAMHRDLPPNRTDSERTG